MQDSGKFVISLDFELLWGVRDKKSETTYGASIVGVHEAIPKMLQLFKEYDTKATFATVGFLFASNKKEIIDYLPEITPKYIDNNLSPYNYLNKLNDSKGQELHYAPSLIQLINEHDHEVASHTFSHYYCLEPGQTVNSFEEDMTSAVEIAKSKDISLKSLVFPRNQFNQSYLNVIEKLGITSYRGNEKAWFYNPSTGKDDTTLKRIFRLIDTYINISGHNTYTIEQLKTKSPINIPSSRFLRPYKSRLKLIESIRIKRIKNSMTHAAKNNEIFHLWWHPHNFGVNQDENFNALLKVLKHYKSLNAKYGFESVTMNKLTNIIEAFSDE